MKWFLGVTCLTVCLAVVASHYCSSEDECKEDECCVAWNSYDLVLKGHCMKLSRKGAHCNKPEAKVDYYGGKYVHDCPCRQGLVCETRGQTSNSSSFLDKDRLRCRVIPTTVDPDATTEEISTVPEEVTEQETLTTEDVAEGPGGEPPRDDDCENWEYPC